MIKLSDFCRQWIICDPGEALIFPAETQFEIEEAGNGRYLFVPLSAGCPLAGADLAPVSGDEIPEQHRFKHGKRLQAAMRYTANVPDLVAVYFTLNKIGKRRFIISIHPDDGKDHAADGGDDDIRAQLHGGPHGIDD